MESKKLGMKIQDWAASLGFTLPDGSAPPSNYFALLLATPHRRQLWEALIESVQPRQKIEQMRKQILVAKLQNRKKHSTTSNLKHVTDRFDLWQKQNSFESDVKEKTNAVFKLEKNILAKMSDSVFEICKLSELEKLLEEFGEKSMVLKLLLSRRKKMIDVFEKRLVKIKEDFCSGDGRPCEKENPGCLEKNLSNVEECKCVLNDHSNCKLLHKIRDLCESGMSEECLWQEIIKRKGILLDEFSRFLETVNSDTKSVLREKESELEKKLNLSIMQLKQKTTEKSLQVMINSTNGKLLDARVKELEESLFEEVARVAEGSLNESGSFLVSGDVDKPTRDEGDVALKNFRNYLNVKELECYREFLKQQLARLDEETRKRKSREATDGDEEIQNCLKVFESTIEEINLSKSEGEKLEREILDCYGKLQTLLRVLREETETKTKTGSVDSAGEKLKSASEKQVDLILETPLDVFRTIETPGRISFECEFTSHYLNNYGGDSKQLFSAMLIPPAGDLQEILTEVERRKKVLNEMKEIISEREKLTELQKKIKNELSSVSYDTRTCEKNFKDSDGILWSVASKTDRLLRDVDFVEKILQNWVEQPYRLMIKETTWGKGLKESEEKYVKGKND